MHKPVVVRLIGELRHEVHTFVRQEAELIKAEFREKTAHYREGSVVAAGGGVAVYAAFIVCLAGLGFLLSCLFERLRLDPILARFVGFSIIGLLTSGAGVLLLWSNLKSLCKQSFSPQKTVDSIGRILPMRVKSTEPVAKPAGSRSSKDLEISVLATERRLTETLEKITRKANPMRYVGAAVSRVQAHPYRWGLVALGAGFVGSFILLRHLSASAKSSEV